MNTTVQQFHKFAHIKPEQLFQQVIPSTLFGEIKVARRKLVYFPSGIPGLQQEKQFAFLDIEEYRPLTWMISTSGQYHFPVVPLSSLQAEHLDDISQTHYLPLLNNLINNRPHCATYVIVRLDPNIQQVSLKAPIIVYLNEYRGEQLILDSIDHSHTLVA